MKKGLSMLLALVMLLLLCAAGTAEEVSPQPFCSLKMDQCLDWIREFQPNANVRWDPATWDIYVDSTGWDLHGNMLADETILSLSLSMDSEDEPDPEVTLPVYEAALDLFGDISGIRFDGVRNALQAATPESPAELLTEGASCTVYPEEMTLSYQEDCPEDKRVKLDQMERLVKQLFAMDHVQEAAVNWSAQLTGSNPLTLTTRITDRNLLTGASLSDRRGNPEETRKVFRSLAGLYFSGEDLEAANELIDSCAALEDEKFSKSLRQEGYNLVVRKTRSGEWTMNLTVKSAMRAACASFVPSARELALAQLHDPKAGQPVPGSAATAAPAEPGPPPEYLPGLWKLATLDLGDRIYTAKEAYFKAYFEFARDTREISYKIYYPGTPVEAGTMTYDILDNQIMFHYWDLNEAGVYDPEKDLITGTFSFLGNVPVTIERAAPDETMPTPVPTPEPFVLTEEMKPLLGTWVLTFMRPHSGNFDLPEEKLKEYGISGSLTLNADGSAVFADMENVYNYSWNLQEDTIEIRSPHSSGVSTFLYDREQPKLIYSDSNADMYYTREASD